MGLSPVDVLSTEIGWLISLCKYEGLPLGLDPYQIRFIGQKSAMRSVLKARQVGFSFEIAAESLARCHLRKKHASICVSYNLDDAKEKINKVNELYEELPLEFQRRKIMNTKTEIQFSPIGGKGNPTRVISYPSKAPRGKTGDIYLDELAHCQNDEDIYNGATALILRSGGQLTVGSTPLGRRGKFHAIHTQEFEKYPGYWRQEVPWWLCRHLCRDPKKAAREATGLSTHDRVSEFGTGPLRTQYDALALEHFQQEFELLFVDESVSFFPYEIINPCCTKEKLQIPMYATIEGVAAKSSEYSLVAGFDVGRMNHPSELVIFQDTGSPTYGDKYVMRYREQFKRMPFPDQRERLMKILNVLGNRLKVLRIDATGLGKNLAEDLKKASSFRSRIQEMIFTAPVKEELANNLKILLLDKEIVMPKDRDIIGQIHSIKQRITSSGNSVFHADKGKGHHADIMWAIAMAVYRKRHRKKVVVPHTIDVRVIGDKSPDAETRPDNKRDSLVEKLFSVPSDREPEPVQVRASNLAVIQRSPEDIKEMARQLLIAAKAWKKSGRDDKARELLVQYQNLKSIPR
jgi:phage FluMu gp28-like protein